MVPTAALAADLAGEGLSGVRVVGRGVDTSLFDPARRSATLRTQWGVDGDGPACLYVGRLAAEKNLALVEKTFAAIQVWHPRARMVWVGDGPSARQLAVDHPEHHFAGLRLGEDLAAHYASADLFLFPSLTETYGNVVAEAMASGLPVVAYRSAAAAELIVDGSNGCLAAPGDEEAYRSAALDLVSAPECLPALGAAARQTMLGHQWAAVVDRFESVVREALA
jgi:glycosyltransferase involved in cell wall biosynthesis